MSSASRARAATARARSTPWGFTPCRPRVALGKPYHTGHTTARCFQLGGGAHVLAKLGGTRGGGAAAPAAQKASPAHRNTENTNFDPQASVGSCARGRRGACRERAIGASTGLCCRMRQAAPLVDRHLAPHMLWGPPARSTSGGCIGVPESGEQGRVTGLRRRPAPPAPMCAGRPVFQVSRQSDGSAQRSQSRSPHRRRRCKRRPSSTSES